MLTQTIPSYLYQEFADDDDLQAFVAAYNRAAQTYVDWLNQVGLPYYPGLSGPLLNWVVPGLYGLQRTALASPKSTALGPLNTTPFNTIVVNGYLPGTVTIYNIDDDIFQRILTWDFYKGDGKRFCTSWLKRRVMRFLLGVNGVDPRPSDPGFVIGVENTQAIGVHISSGTLTVTINQTLLSALATVTPGILTLFQAAFQGGALELPVQYSYAVTIISSMTILLSPDVLTSSSRAFAQSTALTAATATGGSGIYTYAWTWSSGGTGITIDNSTGVTTTFSASGMTWGQTLSGLALCIVTDTSTSLTATATCTVTINCVPPSQLLTETSAFNLETETGTPLLIEA